MPPHYPAEPLPLAKPQRIVDRAAIEAARREWCEFCMSYAPAAPIQVHHVKSRGAGGDDVPENLCSLCVKCHELVHRGKIPLDEFWLMVNLHRS